MVAIGSRVLALLIFFLSFSLVDAKSVKVKGYYRKDGTYVAPHYRSSPDHRVYNNWSTKGNVNPYTGAVGAKDPGSTYFPSQSYSPSVYSPPPAAPLSSGNASLSGPIYGPQASTETFQSAMQVAEDVDSRISIMRNHLWLMENDAAYRKTYYTTLDERAPAYAKPVAAQTLAPSARSPDAALEAQIKQERERSMMVLWLLGGLAVFGALAISW